MVNMEKFILDKNRDSVTFTIRIDKDLQERLDELSKKTNRSRNQIISMALRYALDNIAFKE
jgi:predicted transcriptional regulator